MSLLDYSNVCRTCLSQDFITKSVFNIEVIQNQEISLQEMLATCTSISIVKEDIYPKNICIKCIEDLRTSFSFKKLCEKSDVTLRTCFNSSSLHTEESSIYDYKEADAPSEEQQTWEREDEIHTIVTDDYYCSENEKNIEEKPESPKLKCKRSYKCDECSEECLGLASYWKHMAKIHGKIFKCELCEKEFKSQTLLSQHKSTHQNIDAKPKRIRNKTGIIKKRNLPRTCEICNKTFRFHSNLERHKLIHTGEKPYLCNICGKGFGQMSYLKIHTFIHTGEKPYKCQMCDKRFAAPGTLLTHIRIHTGERPHICKICGKDFPQSGYLSAHIRTHTGEKPVECKVCHRRFNQSGRLVIHMRIHSGEKPYSCKECGRSFAVKGTLKKHIRTHTGERPYVCSVCGQAFAQSGTLATHMKVHKAKT